MEACTVIDGMYKCDILQSYQVPKKKNFKKKRKKRKQIYQSR